VTLERGERVRYRVSSGAKGWLGWAGAGHGRFVPMAGGCRVARRLFPVCSGGAIQLIASQASARQ
jgi:hypothetical protein